MSIVKIEIDTEDERFTTLAEDIYEGAAFEATRKEIHDALMRYLEDRVENALDDGIGKLEVFAFDRALKKVRRQIRRPLDPIKR